MGRITNRLLRPVTDGDPDRSEIEQVEYRDFRSEPATRSTAPSALPASVLPYPWKDDAARSLAIEKEAIISDGWSNGGKNTLSRLNHFARSPWSSLSLAVTKRKYTCPQRDGISRVYRVPEERSCGSKASGYSSPPHRCHSCRRDNGMIYPFALVWKTMGAGAVLEALNGTLSSEAEMAIATFTFPPGPGRNSKSVKIRHELIG